MEVISVLHMKGGTGDSSYASNSLVGNKVISRTRPVIEEAVSDLCRNATLPEKLCIADLGCASGPNAFLAVLGIMKAMDKIREEGGFQSPEFQVYLNDLPGNDFNTLFRALPQFQDSLKEQLGLGFGPCFFTGVPGSFYRRLFLSKTLHFVHSSYCLQWLSQVPELEDINKGNVYIAITSPPGVIRAYQQQFQKDFSAFLKCRSEEMVTGGCMVLTILGRKSDDPTTKECCQIWELLSMALRDMVSQELTEEKKLDEFNIPHYNPSPGEVKEVVEAEGSFSIDRLDASQVNWNVYENDSAYNITKCIRSVVESLLVNQFGHAVMDRLFQRYREIIDDTISKETTQFFSVIVTLTKRVV
ncbi:S-adenosyl-L-methionine:benzoic acid/salicylic acid carboxyl methyltransferase 3-like [Apium graveolens]|uniref:S-adenosyl-L-methionine:benzoic acid/salicylic acid carboxyl methyltransferase 3-like n=1 Tax=Apium graveolens TaxID=4045 RepID=UPI003D7A2D9E